MVLDSCWKLAYVGTILEILGTCKTRSNYLLSESIKLRVTGDSIAGYVVDEQGKRHQLIFKAYHPSIGYEDANMPDHLSS